MGKFAIVTVQRVGDLGGHGHFCGQVGGLLKTHPCFLNLRRLAVFHQHALHKRETDLFARLNLVSRWTTAMSAVTTSLHNLRH